MGARRYGGPLLKGPRTVVERGDAAFPAALGVVHDPPERLYVLGDPAALVEGLAVVGARKATPYGLGCAQRFASAAARRGIVVISGGARGCDAQAHRAALAAGCPTVAFLGGGCDQLYPAAHYRLFQDIVDAGGAVVSERPWDHPPMPYAFRARNRLIAGLARATLIVEAGLPSGTFSTADEALAANREVLVVPGAITSASSRGANRLIYQGATPIVDDDSFQDAMFSLFGCLKQEDAAEPSPKPRRRARPRPAARGKAVGDAGAGAAPPVGAAPPAGVPPVGMASPVGMAPPVGAAPSAGAPPADVAPAGASPAGAPPTREAPGTRKGDALVAALRAEPLNSDDLHALACRLHAGGDAHAWLMECLVEAEARGLVTRYPDGRWGPAIPPA